MKTIQEIIAQKPIFLGKWEDSDKMDILSYFDESIPSIYTVEDTSKLMNVSFAQGILDNIKMYNNAVAKYATKNLLFAVYCDDGCVGNAFVLFEEHMRLYEVHASHCSCYGLENQFDVEEVTLEALEYRMHNGTELQIFSKDDFAYFKNKPSAKELFCNFIGVEYKHVT